MSILDYYKTYHQNGGSYKLADYVGGDRVLMVKTWLTDNLKAGAKVLDIGCGDGTYSRLMPQFSWTGVDINEEKAEYEGARIVKDIEQTPYTLSSGSQDAVICSEVLEHLFSPERVHLEAARCLKKGGLYVISTPNFDWIEHHLGMFRQVVYDPKNKSHTKEHIRFYTFEAHKQMLEAAGFQIADAMGADVQFSELFRTAGQVLFSEINKTGTKSVGEVDYLLGRMFPYLMHTIGVLAVKK